MTLKRHDITFGGLQEKICNSGGCKVRKTLEAKEFLVAGWGLDLWLVDSVKAALQPSASGALIEHRRIEMLLGSPQREDVNMFAWEGEVVFPTADQMLSGDEKAAIAREMAARRNVLTDISSLRG